MIRYAVRIKKNRPPSSFLLSEDEDGHEILPLFRTEADANEAADRSDLDEWEIQPVVVID